MSQVSWNRVGEGVWGSIHPSQYEVVNVIAADYLDGELKQFLATYSSFQASGKIHHVWTPFGGQYLFDDKSVVMWGRRIDPPILWRYNSEGD